MYDEHFQSCIERVCSVLDGLGLRYHFTGGLAAAFYGEPRFTQDIDLVIQLSVDSPETEALMERLSVDYYINRQSVLDAIRQKRLFQALDRETAITPVRKKRMYYPGTEEAHTNPTRQQGECLRALAGASG